MLIWSIISSADTLVSKYGSTEFKEVWDKEWIAPKWGWKVWIIGALIITVAFMFEFTFRVIRKRETELETELKKEKDKNQRPEYQGRIEEALLGPASYFPVAAGKGRVTVNQEDSILVLKVALFCARDIGGNVGTSVKDYSVKLCIDGNDYEGTWQCPVKELTQILVPLGSANLRVALGYRCIGSLRYLHTSNDHIPFYVKGLKYEEKEQSADVVLTLIDLCDQPHEITGKKLSVVKEQIYCTAG
jgi:hypothetical protein